MPKKTVSLDDRLPDDGESPELPLAKNSNRSQELIRQENRFMAAYLKKCPDDFKVFYSGLKIKAGSVPAVFNRVAYPYQKDFLESVVGPIQQLRNGEMPSHRRWWVERTKKASKDADLALIVAWLVAFPVRPFFGQIGAADGEQAGILKERITDLLFYNPWLNEHIEIVLNQVRSKKKIPGTNKALAHVDILAADAAGGAHGGTPDILIINELTHIQKWEFVTTLLANATGVPHGIVIIATNAGFKGSEAEKMKLNAIRQDFWKVFVWAKPSPWMSADSLADEKRRNTPSSWDRLWLGKWVSGVGDTVTESKIDAAFCRMMALPGPDAGWQYIAGVDLGIKKDHSAVFVMGYNYTKRKLRAAYWQRWKPDPITREVNLIDVQSVVKRVCRIFGVQSLYYDPHQAVLMAQQLMQDGVVCKEMSFSTPSNLMAMATSYIQAMDFEVLELYDDELGTLRQDLGKFKIEERRYGYRITAVADINGHADVGTAMLITLPHAVGALGLGECDLSHLMSVDGDDDGSPLTKSEIDTMDDGLREIYEMDHNVSGYSGRDDGMDLDLDIDGID